MQHLNLYSYVTNNEVITISYHSIQPKLQINHKLHKQWLTGQRKDHSCNQRQKWREVKVNQLKLDI